MRMEIESYRLEVVEQLLGIRHGIRQYRDHVDPAALLADLDDDQQRAVTTDSTLVAVIAGAGSGKTRVLTRRIAHRIAIGTADARHTIALTFTREAAGELRRRIAHLGITDEITAGTFHSVASCCSS